MAYESHKTEDAFQFEFKVPFWLFLEIEKRFDIDQAKLLDAFET